MFQTHKYILVALVLTQLFGTLAYAEKQTQYIKALRELAEAAEQTQISFYGSDYMSASANFKDLHSEKIKNLILQQVLFAQAFAANSEIQTGTCIVAGNIGILNGGHCHFTTEEKTQNLNCGAGFAACNPALYGDNVCIRFSSREDKTNATAHCNAQDTNYTNVLTKYNKNNMTEALIQIQNEAHTIFNHCTEARVAKRITPDQDQTCKVLETRISKLGSTACEDIRKAQASLSDSKGDSKSQSTDPLLSARIKSCDEITKSSCESKAIQLDKSAEDLNKACAANGFKTGDLISPACYPELEKCKKNGFSDKCFSSRESLDLHKIESDLTQTRTNIEALLAQSTKDSSGLLKCFPSSAPQLTGRSKQSDLDQKIAYEDYQKFLKLKTYDYKSDSQLHQQLGSAKNNIEDQRKSWQMYLNRISSENERVLKAIEKHLTRCNLSDSDKSLVTAQLRALQSLNDQMANKFRHNQNLVAPTKNNQPGILDANDIITTNKRDIELWFNSSAENSTFKACCLSPVSKGQQPYLANTKWCNRTNSGIAARIYGSAPTEVEKSLSEKSEQPQNKTGQ